MRMRETQESDRTTAPCGPDASALLPARSAIGAAGSSTALLASDLAERTGGLVLLVVAHLDDADEAADDINAAGGRAIRLPALEVMPGESGVSLELLVERLNVTTALTRGSMPRPAVLVAPIQGLMQLAPSPESYAALVRTLTVGDEVPVDELVRWLDGAGYQRLESIEEPGDFAVRGGIIDVFPPGATSRMSGDASATDAFPIRLDFFGDELESITEIDIQTMGSDRRLQSVEITGANLDAILTDADLASVIPLLPHADTLTVISEVLEVTEQGRGYYERVTAPETIQGPPAVFKQLHQHTRDVIEINQFSRGTDDHVVQLPVEVLPEFSRDAAEAIVELGELSKTHRVHVCCQNEGELSRFGELREEFAPEAEVESSVRYLHRGFIWGEDDRPLALVPYHELLHRFQTRRRIRRLRASKASEQFLELEVGDYVVHADHGIAKFSGLRTMQPRAPKATAQSEAERKLKGRKEKKRAPEEYLTLEFSGNAKLHVPVSQIDRVQKYVGGFRGKPPLSSLGGKRWKKQKEEVREAVRDFAAELIRIQAAREHLPGTRYPQDTKWQKEFEAEFPYEETDDQLAALAEIKKDLCTERPMDRLLCGDVGYGKTELAIRAAFKVAEFGRQIAILVPTTILAEQHEETFRQRFADYPFRVASLSRFKTRKEQNDVLAATRKGAVDILIGTHRLLSKDVKFADLGLVVIDEEQRFGVEHKQKLLELRMTVDVLTLSATPIPRTLHMSMLGLRDISSLSTPPLDRRAVVTEVIPYNEKRIKQAIEREMARDGQVFFVHNRVHNIQSIADDIQRLVPDAQILIGHGQMTPAELESVMSKFVHRRADVLVATTIIESGIDIPTANTMFINGADMFGLASLHQLRGRVGRYKHRAYCYLLLPQNRQVSEVATRRLRAVEEFSMLGAGFKIAMRDLEIRGAGNLLGPEQSGHISAVGYDMYCRLLEQEARHLRNEVTTTPSDTTVELGVTGLLPKSYIPSDVRRLEAYRRIATAASIEDLDQVEEDIRQAYGEPSKSVETLFELARIRVGAAVAGIRAVSLHEQDIIFRCERPEEVEAIFTDAKGTVRTLKGDPSQALREVYYRPPANFLDTPSTLLTVLRRRLAP